MNIAVAILETAVALLEIVLEPVGQRILDMVEVD